MQFKIYPNPTTNRVYVKPSKNINKEVVMKIIDMSGKQVYIEKFHQILANEVYEIDLSALNYGVYYLQISNSKLTKIEKIIKN